MFHLHITYLILHNSYIYLSFHLQREYFSKQYLFTFSEFLPSHSCSCSYCSFTFSTGIQPIAKIAKSFSVSTSLHNISPVALLPHHLLLSDICYKQEILLHLKLFEILPNLILFFLGSSKIC